MPTYDYACQGCGHEFEIFQQMSEPVKRKCPECGRLKLQRLIGTGAGIIFKGGGFYETDYRSDSYKKGAEAEKKAAEPATSNGAACPCGADAKMAAANGCASSGASNSPAKASSKRKRTGKETASK